MKYEIYDHFSHLNDTEAGVAALEEYAEAIDAGKSEVEAEVLASNVLQRAGYNVNAKGGVSIRRNPSLPPDPSDIRTARAAAGLSQTAAAALIYSTLRTWQDWEAGKAAMHPGLFELFLLKTE